MRFAAFLVLSVFSVTAHAADTSATNADTQAALAGSVVQCGAPAVIENAAAGDAIAKAAEADAGDYSRRLTELPARAAESVAALAGTHSLDKNLVAAAYAAAICGRLKEKGVADAELFATLTKLSQDLGVPLAASADGLAVPVEKAADGGISALIAPDGAKQAETPPAEAVLQPPLPAPKAPEKAEETPPASAVIAKQDEADAQRQTAEAQRQAMQAQQQATEKSAARALRDDAKPQMPVSTEAPGGGGAQPPASEKALAGPPAEKSLVRPSPAQPMPDSGAPAEEKSLARPAKKAKAKASDIAALGEEECRALGVLENCPDLNSVLDQLLEKPLEYNRPDKMLLGRKTEISLVLRTDWKGKDLPPEVSAEMKGLPGEVQKGVSKITRVMSAELSGADFDVSPAGRQERTVILPQPVVWSWQVTPTDTGNAKPLKLRLYAHLQGPGGTMPPVLIKTLDATISVDVTAWDWVVGQAKALEPIYAVIAGLLGLLTALLTYAFARKETATAGGGADTVAVRPSGPVLGDIGQSASDSKAPVHAAPLPPPVTAEPEDVPWRPKKPHTSD